MKVREKWGEGEERKGKKKEKKKRKEESEGERRKKNKNRDLLTRMKRGNVGLICNIIDLFVNIKETENSKKRNVSEAVKKKEN